MGLFVFLTFHLYSDPHMHLVTSFIILMALLHAWGVCSHNTLANDILVYIVQNLREFIFNFLLPKFLYIVNNNHFQINYVLLIM